MPASGDPPIPRPDLNLLDERRSAHASIRGYLYQTCLGVLRWLDLRPDEILLCEGDEDLDRFLLDGSAVSEQVKAYTGGLSLTDRVVRDSLRNFLRSYVALRRKGESRRFVFTTTAHLQRQRRSPLNFDLLQAWQAGNRTAEVLTAIRSLVTPMNSREDRAEIEAALAWLDGQPDGWKCFADAVEWSFDAPDLDAMDRTLCNRIATREDTRFLPTEALLKRLIVHVLETSCQKSPGKRTLTTTDLSRLLESAREDLAAWTASGRANRIWAILDESASIKGLLSDGTYPLPENPTPGKLLTAAYEVIPFDEAGRSRELDVLASWCSGAEPQSVLLLTGDGGSGKTRLMIEWCHRLSRQGWHAGFLRRDREASNLDPLLAGSTPRLVVVDYAEARLQVLRPLLLKIGESRGEGPKFRLILLGRRESDWWASLSRKDREIEDLLGDPRKLHKESLPPMPRELDARERVFRAALETFSQCFGTCPPAGLDVSYLGKKEFERILYVHMAALAAAEGRPIESAGEALMEALKHERRFWYRQVDESFDKAVATEITEALSHAVAALTMVGGVEEAERARVLTVHILKPFCLPPSHAEKILRLVKDLYTAEKSGRYLDPLEPDLLGEELVASILSRPFLLSLLDISLPREAQNIMRMLILLTRRRVELDPWLGVALNHRPDLYKVVQETSGEAGDPTGGYWRRG